MPRLLFSNATMRIDAIIVRGRFVNPGTRCGRFSFLAGLKVRDSFTFIVGCVSRVVIAMTFHRVLGHYGTRSWTGLSHFSVCKNR